MRKRIIPIFWILTILFSLGMAGNLFPWLRGDVPWLPGDLGWVWPYELPRWAWVIPSILGVVVYLLGLTYLLGKMETNDNRHFRLRLILWAALGSALLPLLLMTMEGSPLYLLFTRTASTLTGGYLYASVEISNLSQTLSHWTDFVLEYRKLTPFGGVALSPPGLATLYYALGKGFEAVPVVSNSLGAILRPVECQNLLMTTWSNSTFASAFPQMLMPVWSMLAVAPLYRLGVFIFNRKAARWAVALWPLIPGLDIFQPRFNILFVLIALVMLVFLWHGLEKRCWWQVLLAGFIVSVATFLNLSVVPLGLLGGLTILGQSLLRFNQNVGATNLETSDTKLTLAVGPYFRRMIPNMVLFALGVASVWGIYGLLSGQSIIEVIKLALSLHLILNRPYVQWLFMHTYDVYLFTGLPIAILAIWQIGRAVWKAKRWRRLPIPTSRADVYAWAAALTLIIMVLSGTARGETGRVWLFFVPLWVLLAAYLLQEFALRQRMALTVMQAIVMFSMVAVLRANFTTLTVPPDPQAAINGPTYTLNKQFSQGNDRLTLVGLDVGKSTVDGIDLRLYWRADDFITQPYELTLVSVPPDKSVRDSYNWSPEDREYPPACWVPGKTFVDVVKVPESTQPGDWLFSLSVVQAFSKQAMAVNGQVNPQVGIGPVHVDTP